MGAALVPRALAARAPPPGIAAGFQYCIARGLEDALCESTKAGLILNRLQLTAMRFVLGEQPAEPENHGT